MVSFESRMRNRFPTPSFLKKLEDVPLEERGIIPLENIQNRYESVPRRVQVVLQAYGGPTPY
jgi:hypothetical protein